MTKARTKGQKRGRPRTRARGGDGEPLRQSPERTQQVTQTVVDARLRHAGMDTAEIRRHWGDRAARMLIDAAKAFATMPWAGCEAGRRIAAEDDASELWETVKAIRSAYAANLRAIDAPNPWPKTASLGDAPPPGEDEAVIVDLRTEEERALAARQRWAGMVRTMRARGDLSLIVAVVLQDARVAGNLPMALRRVQDDACSRRD